MRKALLIGITRYCIEGIDLAGCVNDVNNIYSLLRFHEDGRPNFDCEAITSGEDDHNPPAGRRHDTSETSLRKRIINLFSGESSLTVFYYSGHGAITKTGGYIATKDSQPNRMGISMSEILELANTAVRERRHKQVIIILDCCYSGRFGAISGAGVNFDSIASGISILTAAESDQVAYEKNGSGVLSSIICAALEGGAADILGNVTLASVYSLADQLLGAFEQRPVFKANINEMASLRHCVPKIPLEMLRGICDPDMFSIPDLDFELDPSFEPESKNPDDYNVNRFLSLKKFNRLGLVVPYNLPFEELDMFWAAMRSTGCRLTHLGKFYWQLAKKGKF